MKIKGLFAMMLAMTLMFSACGKKPQQKEPEPFDYNSLPFYDANATEKTFPYDEAAMARPFWLGNVMHNESVMFIQTASGGAEATTLFKPQKVLSVRDWTLKVEYKEGVDYEVLENGKLSILPNSSIPTFNDDWFYGKNMPEGYEKIDSLDVTGNKYHIFNGVGDSGESVDVVYTEGPLFYSNYF